MLNLTHTGFGDENANFNVYIGNKPNMIEYKGLEIVKPLVIGEINYINQSCGNGWRKVFNVYAKLLFSLDKARYKFSSLTPTWQEYRDNYLLQKNSNTALCFSIPIINADKPTIHIICGKGHAKKLAEIGRITGGFVVNLKWLDEDFAIDTKNKVIVCPYFDYRQLSNIKIIRLSELLNLFK